MLHELPGLDADALLEALDTPPSVSLRVNPRKIRPDMPLPYTDMRGVEWCAEGYYLDERPVFTLHPWLHAGGFYVQDASSMIHSGIMKRISAAIDATCGSEATPLSLLDFCAAPGGKTTAMISALPEGSVVTANEFMASRGKILRENLEKWGYPAVITTGASAADYASLPEIFDVIAVDAPCSGEGMMRKEEVARSQWSRSLVSECAALQREILTDVCRTLRPGGYLIYSTCTFNPEEDEENARFIRDSLGLQPVGLAELGLKGVEPAGRALCEDVEALRFMPHLTCGEGLFVSVFRRPGTLVPWLLTPAGAPANYVAECQSNHRERGKGAKCERRDNRGSRGSGKAERGAKGKPEPASRAILTPPMRSWLESLMRPDLNMQLHLNDSLVSALPAAAEPILALLLRANVRVTGAGLPVGELKGADAIPDSRLPLSLAMRSEAFPRVELSMEDALRYLRREAIPLPDDTPKGYVTVCYRSLPLGLMKNLGNRANNLFPAPWRIKI